jgi:hypothetical protein
MHTTVLLENLEGRGQLRDLGLLDIINRDLKEIFM